MRLFSYYAFCSVKNQIKKLLKTWVFIFILACAAIGGIAGAAGAALSDVAEETETTEDTQTEYMDEDMDEDFFSLDIGISRNDTVELMIGGALLVLFVFGAVGAQKGANKIFLPADVNLLFASPMEPQSVLLFRLMTQLGLILFASVYFLCQIPNLMMSLQLSLWSALTLVMVWFLAFVWERLLQLFLYTAASTHPLLKKHMRTVIYAVLALILAGYMLYFCNTPTLWYEALNDFFNAPVSRSIPVWGWLKGLAMFAIEGNQTAAGICFAALTVSGIALAWVIWHMKADFYEDAMHQSEETAELLERAQEEGSGGIVFARRKKDRSESLRRDGLRHGQGANVFFFKSMYNRFRFAHLGFFTKTMETYLVAALGVSLFCRYAIGAESIVPVALTLAGLTFFRSLGNPLEQDTRMDFFVMIPENTWAKMFWSLMGGTANCLLDVFLPMLAATFVLRDHPLFALAWILFIISVDFYATNVGVFINLSVPVSAGKTLKQVVQIMFIYFGLLPDIGILAVTGVFGYLAVGAVAATLFNAALGFLFFAISPAFLEPK